MATVCAWSCQTRSRSLPTSSSSPAGTRSTLARFRICGVLDSVALADGFPMLDEHFQTTLDGLYITGYSATRDFGPFFGFVKGSPAAATLIVRDLVARSGPRAGQTPAATATVLDPPAQT